MQTGVTYIIRSLGHAFAICINADLQSYDYIASNVYELSALFSRYSFIAFTARATVCYCFVVIVYFYFFISDDLNKFVKYYPCSFYGRLLFVFLEYAKVINM